MTEDERSKAANSRSSQPLGWVEENQSIAIALAFVLILLYVLPVILVGIAAISTDGFQQPSSIFSWFVAFMASSESTLNEFHKVLLPIISALSVIVFRGAPDWRFLGLCIFILMAFVYTIFIGVFFDIQRVKDAIDTQVVDLKLVKAFFTRLQETLLMYLMMLLGITVSNAGRTQGQP